MASAKEKILKESEVTSEEIEEIKAEMEAIKAKLAEVEKLANDLLNSIRMA